MDADEAMNRLRAARALLYFHSQRRDRLIRLRQLGAIEAVNVQIADARERVQQARAAVHAALLEVH